MRHNAEQHHGTLRHHAHVNTVFAMCVASLGLLIIGSPQKRKPRQTTGLQTLNPSTLSAFFLIEHVGFIFPNMYAKDLLNSSEHVNLQRIATAL